MTGEGTTGNGKRHRTTQHKNSNIHYISSNDNIRIKFIRELTLSGIECRLILAHKI